MSQRSDCLPYFFAMATVRRVISRKKSSGRAQLTIVVENTSKYGHAPTRSQLS